MELAVGYRPAAVARAGVPAVVLPPAAAYAVYVAADERRAVAAPRGLPRRFASSGIRRVGGPVFVRVDQLSRPVEDVLAAVPVRVRHRPALT